MIELLNVIGLLIIIAVGIFGLLQVREAIFADNLHRRIKESLIEIAAIIEKEKHRHAELDRKKSILESELRELEEQLRNQNENR